MTAEDVVGFWSYTHRDNDLDGGRIRTLAQDIENAYELQTAERLQLFVDTDIAWGEEWKSVIDSELVRTTFFIPIVTPKYLRSEQCRREFLEFSTRVATLGRESLLLPILYVDTPEILNSDTLDEIAVRVRATQYVKWQALRLNDSNSAAYRKAVEALASRLVAVVEKFAQDPLRLELAAPAEVDEDDDSPGLMDHIAAAEEAFPRMNSTLTSLAAAVREIGEIAERGATKVAVSDKRGTGARGRLTILGQLASELNDPADKILTLGADYVRQLVDIDSGIRALVELAKRSEDPADVQAVGEFFAVIRTLDEQTAEAEQSLRTLIDSFAGVESLSNVIRKPLKKLRTGLSGVLDGNTMIRGWRRLIDPDLDSE